MTNKISFSCLFVGVLAFGFSGMAAATLKAQSIKFDTAPENVTVSGALGTVRAVATSELPVIFTSNTPGVCSISGNKVAGLAQGTCIIRANQSGNAIYAPAPQAVQSFSVKVSDKVSSGSGSGGSSGGSSSGSGSGGTKLAVTAPFDCTKLASSGNAADDGRRAYNRLNCVSCHGQDGSGGMGPDIRGEGGDVAEAVNGEGAMPSYAGFLCPNDVIDLQAYLSSISRTAKYLDWDLPIQQIKDGDPMGAASGIVPGP